MEREPARRRSSSPVETLAALFYIALILCGLLAAIRWLDLDNSLAKPADVPAATPSSIEPDPPRETPAPALPAGTLPCELQGRVHDGTKPGAVQEACLRAKEYAFARVASEWGPKQWPCLDNLWTGESSWDAWAVNPTSGAYGIPQILPAAHGRPPGTELGNWSGQVDWGLAYIEERYVAPCEAWGFWQRQSPHWY